MISVHSTFVCLASVHHRAQNGSSWQSLVATDTSMTPWAMTMTVSLVLN